MSEQDPGIQHDRQALLQDVVRRVFEAHAGGDVRVVREALVATMAEAGIPEQPPVWFESTADEIAEGRHVVVDRHEGVSNGPGADEVPDAAGR